MKAIHTLPILTVTMLAGLPLIAIANAGPNDPISGEAGPALKTEWITSARTEPDNMTVQSAQQGQIMAGPGDGAAGPLTAKSNTNVQSPRDPASGVSTPPAAQRNAVCNKNCQEFESITAPREGQAKSDTAVGTPPPQTQAQYNPKELQVQSPRDPASGQSGNAQTTDGFKNVEGLSDDREFIGRNAGTGDPASGQASENRQQSPDTGQSANKLGNFEIQDVRATADETTAAILTNATVTDAVREGGANDTTHRAKKPPRDRASKRGKRKPKP
jgi:hypothetical protein